VINLNLLCFVSPLACWRCPKPFAAMDADYFHAKTEEEKEKDFKE
jgi:hypothetical protein